MRRPLLTPQVSQPRVTLLLRQERLSAACGPWQEERGLKLVQTDARRPALNISSEGTARDLDAWIGSGMTCLENGGMTHPIRLVAFLLAQQHNASYGRLAEQALNGTMYGCCYGPYNLRNEIDRHNSTVGGHGSNTHFVRRLPFQYYKGMPYFPFKSTREHPPSLLILQGKSSSPSNITREHHPSLLRLQGNALLPF